MWKTDWVPDWIYIYTSSQQIIYHEPKPAFSHLCESVRVLWIGTPFYLLLSYATVCTLHLITENLDVSKVLGEMSLTLCVWVTGGWDKSSRGSKPNLWAPSRPDSYNSTRSSNYLSLFVYFLTALQNEISWCVSECMPCIPMNNAHDWL